MTKQLKLRASYLFLCLLTFSAAPLPVIEAWTAGRSTSFTKTKPSMSTTSGGVSRDIAATTSTTATTTCANGNSSSLLRYRRDPEPGAGDEDDSTRTAVDSLRSRLLKLGMPTYKGKTRSRRKNATEPSKQRSANRIRARVVRSPLLPKKKEQKQKQKIVVVKKRINRPLSKRIKTRNENMKKVSPPVIVTNAQELRNAVFDQGVELKDIEFRDVPFQPSRKMNATVLESVGSVLANDDNDSINNDARDEDIRDDGREHEREHARDGIGGDDVRDALNHEVIKLIEKRFKSGSKPGARSPDDDARLALSIEGGGMRGAVSAGMASAIAVLGLSDTFDCIYGSSAGSVIGAYMVSRQMCIDVYTDVLTSAKTKFVSKGRLASSLATNLFDQKILNTTTDVFSRYVSPAMNISFVLDSIMCPEKGLRPLDMETFRINDEVQQLRVVTSTVRQGRMETHCLGSATMDFFDKTNDETGEVMEYATTNTNEGGRHGLFAALETSMLVPAATGPPQPLLRHGDAHLNLNATTFCFDAFCYEPIPYRSAVKEGASHVLVLKSRPTGSPIGTKPGLFEKVFAPMYFDRNGMPEVSTYFNNGGQQYIYTEDYLTLEEGRKASSEGVRVPPPKILYGVDRDEEAEDLVANRDKWNKAHLFPLAVPEGKPELSTLSVDADEVCEAVRLGFACAFDLLAPVTGVNLNPHLDGDRVAELLFSHAGISPNALKDPISFAGSSIVQNESVAASVPLRKDNSSLSLSSSLSSALNEMSLQRELFNDNGEFVLDTPCPRQDASELLESLPGFHQGRMESLSLGLRELKRGSRGRTKI